MDVTPLLDPTMLALTTFLAGMADGAAHKAGEAVFEQSKRIYEAVKARFAREADGGKASQALTILASDPDNKPVVEAKLTRILQSDPAFAEALRQLVQTGPIQRLVLEENAKASRVRMRNSARTGTQEGRGGSNSEMTDIDVEIS